NDLNNSLPIIPPIAEEIITEHNISEPNFTMEEIPIASNVPLNIPEVTIIDPVPAVTQVEPTIGSIPDNTVQARSHIPVPSPVLNLTITTLTRLHSIWRCLVRAAKLPARIPQSPSPATSNPLPALSKLLVKERLSYSMPDLHQIPTTNSKWKGKGKGKGKRLNPYPSPAQHVPSLISQQPYPPHQNPQSVLPNYPSTSQKAGGQWTTPPYSAPTVAPPAYNTQTPPT
ncbi:unnamed protein product, partial [Rotaria socialis]